MTDAETGTEADTDAGTGTEVDTDAETTTEAGAETPSASDNQPPEPGAPTVSSVPVRIDNEETFVANRAEDPDGEIVSYEWDFGDGGSATGERVTHTFDELGEVDVSVTVTDDDGATATATQSYEVVEQAFQPTASFYTTGTTVVGQEMELYAEGAGPGGEIETYEWEFPDGTTATGQNVTHTFDSAGTHDVTLTVMSSDMVTDTVTQSVRVTPDRDAQVSFWFEPDVPVAGEDIRFAVDTPGLDEEVNSYEWDFGDGTATGDDVEHAFESGGTYNVTVTVTTDTQTLTASRDVDVRESGDYPITELCYDHGGPAVGEEIEFWSGATPPQYANADTIEWDFGDGTTATGSDVTHAYDEPGTYEVSVTKTVDGESNTVTRDISVQSSPDSCSGGG